jgi:hypothetical protein
MSEEHVLEVSEWVDSELPQAQYPIIIVHVTRYEGDSKPTEYNGHWWLLWDLAFPERKGCIPRYWHIPIWLNNNQRLFIMRRLEQPCICIIMFPDYGGLCDTIIRSVLFFIIMLSCNGGCVISKILLSRYSVNPTQTLIQRKHVSFKLWNTYVCNWILIL